MRIKTSFGNVQLRGYYPSRHIANLSIGPAPKTDSSCTANVLNISTTLTPLCPLSPPPSSEPCPAYLASRGIAYSVLLFIFQLMHTTAWEINDRVKWENTINNDASEMARLMAEGMVNTIVLVLLRYPEYMLRKMHFTLESDQLTEYDGLVMTQCPIHRLIVKP